MISELRLILIYWKSIIYEIVFPEKYVASFVNLHSILEIDLEIFRRESKSDYPSNQKLKSRLKKIKPKELDEKFEPTVDETTWEKTKGEYREALQKAIDNDIRDMILNDDIRPDNRKMNEVRQLSSEEWPSSRRPVPPRRFTSPVV